MSDNFKKVKALLQRPAPPKKFGTDPMEPWSAPNQVAEDSIKGERASTLARYLKSRGINPTFVSKNQRIAHTKSDSYRKWMRDHMFEEVEELDEVLTKATTAGETIHDFVHSKNKIFAGDSKKQRIRRALGAYYKKQNEEIDKDMTEMYGSSAQVFHNPQEYLDSIQKKKEAEKKSVSKVTNLVKKPNSTQMTVKKEDVSEEKKDTRTASEKMSDYAVKRHKVYQDIADKQKEHVKKWNEDHKDEPHLQIPVKEDIQQDSQSATQTTFDMGNNTDDTSQTFNRVKRAMKKKHVKEDTYDWEKADKSVASPGKKPKMDKSNEKDGEGVAKPKAAAVLSGGTTMTGEPRDTIEIDPSMRGRPGQDGGMPSDKKKINSK